MSNKSPIAEDINRICHVIPFEERSNNLADETTITMAA